MKKDYNDWPTWFIRQVIGTLMFMGGFVLLGVMGWL